MPVPAFRGVDHVPSQQVLVPSGDYKSADPAAVVMEIGGPLAAVCASLRVTLDVTAASGGGGVTVNIEAWDEGSQTWYLLLASAVVVATGKTHYIVTPWFAAVANVSAQTTLTPSIRVRPVGSGTRTTLNYSITATLSA